MKRHFRHGKINDHRDLFYISPQYIEKGPINKILKSRAKHIIRLKNPQTKKEKAKPSEIQNVKF